MKKRGSSGEPPFLIRIMIPVNYCVLNIQNQAVPQEPAPGSG